MHSKIFTAYRSILAALVTQTVKNLSIMWETGFNSWVGKIPWRRDWLPTPVFLPGKPHGQRSLAGCSTWGHRESDSTERLTLSILHTRNHPKHWKYSIEYDKVLVPMELTSRYRKIYHKEVNKTIADSHKDHEEYIFFSMWVTFALKSKWQGKPVKPKSEGKRNR